MPASGSAGTVTGGQGNLVPNVLLNGVPLAVPGSAGCPGCCARGGCWEFPVRGWRSRIHPSGDRTVGRSVADTGDALTTEQAVQ